MTQRDFAAHIRDPEHYPAPRDVDPVRMAAYRKLFFSNIERLVAAGFPVLKSLMGQEEWLALIRDFYARHRSVSPLYTGIAEEFLVYLKAERAARASDPPYLLELAHYEWVNLTLAVAEAEPPAWLPDFRESALTAPVSLSPLAWPLVYGFPVQQINPGYVPGEAPALPTCLVVYRDRGDRVRFLEVNQVTYRLLDQLKQAPQQPLVQHLRQLAVELRRTDLKQVLAFGADLVTQLHDRGIVGRGP